MKCGFKKQREELYPEQRACLCRATRPTENRSISRTCVEEHFRCLKRNYQHLKKYTSSEKDTNYTDKVMFLVGIAQRSARSVNLNVHITVIIHRLVVDVELNFLTEDSIKGC